VNGFFLDKFGKEIFVTGLQCHNSSTGTDLMDKAISAIKLYGGNTLEAPVYWYAIEPEMDRYDMTQLRDLVDQARLSGLHLIVLWFAASKNGHPNYAPEYIKLHPETYRIAIGADGAPVASL
jgi:beta-galactosidase GanA